MSGVPTFLQSESVTISRTQNGYALTAVPEAPVVQSLSFESLDALTYYLGVNFPKPVTP
jgi:hypothetical protein